jgi:ATP-dependent helicase/nuclease subunit B
MPEFLDAMMAGRPVRPRYGTHPRLAIYGLLEARLLQADLVIMGGMNEGSWPPEPPPDPWMSRPMRAEFGLPQPERRIGLSAHDFAQAFCAPSVMITRPDRIEGAPTVGSRWLLRLEALMARLGLPDDDPLLRWPDRQWSGWATKLDEATEIRPVSAPAPCPPVAARPRNLSITEIEDWRRDPYAIYARHILKLRPVEPLDQDPGAADRGTLIHAAMEEFVREFPAGPLPANAAERLLEIGRQIFKNYGDAPGVMALWWPRFERAAVWFVEEERAHRAGLDRAVVEQSGKIILDGPEGAFELRGKADRIDLRTDGGVTVIDYKTGSIASAKDVSLGFSPQLPLGGLIAQRGGFADVPAAKPVDGLEVDRLEYWQLSGGVTAGAVTPAGGSKSDAGDLITDAEAGLLNLIADYDSPTTAYNARPAADFKPGFSDYALLARIKEWSAASGDDE